MAATDIKNDPTLSTDLVSCWLSDSSGLLTDLVTATGNDLTNSSVVLTTDLQGDAGDFEETNNAFLSILDNVSLSFTGDVSFSMWVTPEDVVSGSKERNSLIAKYVASENQRSYRWFHDWNGGTPEFRFQSTTSGSGPTTADWTFTMVTATRYHLVVTYDASAGSAEMWIDASSQGTDTAPGTSLFDGTAPFEIGRDGGSLEFDGIINQVVVWDKVLSDDEVSDLYNGGSGIPFEGAVADNAIFFGANF